ncbi:hypothetical protein ABVT39_012078 [Epinephelus coioides]
MGEAARSRLLFSLRGVGDAQWIPHSPERKKAPSDRNSDSPGKMIPPPPFINAVCESHVKGSAIYEDSSFFDH